MFDPAPSPASRVARSSSTERASGSACAIATKLYWPPTPDTTRPSSRPSDTAAPSAVAIMQVLKRSEEHTSELQSLMRNSYAVFCLKKKNTTNNKQHNKKK